MKKQVLVIHGGETFSSYEDYLEYLQSYEIDFEKDKEKNKGWKGNLQEDLGDKFEVIQPQMPSPRNAKYLEWKIWLEKYFPFLKENIILIGHSLGGIFWVKYLSENNFPVKISQLHLVATPFENNNDISGETQKYNLSDFNFSSENLQSISKQTKNIFLYHSKDDNIVPFDDLRKYLELFTNAEKNVFENRDHFLMERFPEIVKRIKNSF